uniref:Uncharacterized protein n=1 Tax=Triticum urartu TaxID=4572 RepID=A0A8R7QQL2_TRIUA
CHTPIRSLPSPVSNSILAATGTSIPSLEGQTGSSSSEPLRQLSAISKPCRPLVASASAQHHQQAVTPLSSFKCSMVCLDEEVEGDDF